MKASLLQLALVPDPTARLDRVISIWRRKGIRGAHGRAGADGVRGTG
jgi:hypothetical protein